MAENDNINHYSAADIERYHKGQLSPEEMHAMEKAALDDPFLADAMEGYKNKAGKISADISFLQDKLKQRIAGTKVVELKSYRNRGWLKAAVSIIIIIGAGILVYQFAINQRSNNVAKLVEPKQNKEVITQPAADSSRANISTNINDAAKTDMTKIITNTNDVAKAEKTIKDQKIENKDLLKLEKTEDSDYKSDTVNNLQVAPQASASKVIKNDSIYYEPGRNLARTGNSNSRVLVQSKNAEGEASGTFDLNKYSSKNKQAGYLNTNVFRGQVLDANYNALPFANITSTRDKVGTYADAKGNFILTSSDSVLNVQIKFVGFENSVALLRNDLPKNQVILQEDTKNLNEIVINNKKSNSSRRKLAKIEVEEPEPEDGWENYDTYIVNNLNIPDELQIKSPGTREVEISFNVNKNGQPVNLKVEKSVCKECDQEAIRLLKEGPKWKSKGKKSRVSITVPF